MQIINDENYGEAIDAVKDILMMYVYLANTAGFGHNADVCIRFDPLKYIDAEADDPGTNYVDLDLLQSGSAVAILCAFYNLWTEEQELDRVPYTKPVQAAVDEGRFNKFPDIEAVIVEAIRRNSAPIEDLWIEDALVPIYRKYILSFFTQLARQVR